MCSRFGVAHAVAVPQCRVGLFCAIQALIKPGQKVILSPYTIADVVNMIVAAGGVPTFADIDRASCNISAASVEKLIGPEVGLVLVTHFYGQIADIDEISAIAAKHSVPVIEDAAQCLGGKHNGRFAGTLGKAGVLSFGLYKNVNAFYGGMVLTDDAELAASIRQKRDGWPVISPKQLGAKAASGFMTDLVTWPPVFKTFSFRFFRWAFLNDVERINNKLKIDVSPVLTRTIPQSYLVQLSPLQARMIREQLDHVAEHQEHRLAAAKLYHEGLRDLDQLILAPIRTDGSHIYWYYPIQYKDRRALVAYAMENGRDVTMSYHRNCAALECFSDFAADCPNAAATADQLIYLPTYPRYSHDEIRRNVDVIRRFFRK